MEGQGPGPVLTCAVEGCSGELVDFFHCADHQDGSGLVECPIPGCNNEQNLTTGLCELHSTEFNSGGPSWGTCAVGGCTGALVDYFHCAEHQDKSYANVCPLPGCTNEKSGKNLCDEHWNRLNDDVSRCTVDGCFKELVDFLHCEIHQDKTSQTQCQHPGCTNEKTTKGLCEQHWNQFNGDVVICESPGCTSKKEKKGLCLQHWKESNADAKFCGMPQCNNIKRKQGLCHKHWNLMHSSTNICEVSGCNNIRHMKSLCVKHWSEMHPEKSKCQFTSCNNRKKMKGMCIKHYKAMNPTEMTCEFPGCTRWKRVGKFCTTHLNEISPGAHECEFPECGRRKYRRGLCHLHYAGGDYPPQAPKNKNPKRTCHQGDCLNDIYVDGLCGQHVKELHPEMVPADACTHPECFNKQSKYGMCDEHFVEPNLEDPAWRGSVGM